jgi:hypothetical protein
MVGHQAVGTADQVEPVHHFVVFALTLNIPHLKSLDNICEAADASYMPTPFICFATS